MRHSRLPTLALQLTPGEKAGRPSRTQQLSLQISAPLSLQTRPMMFARKIRVFPCSIQWFISTVCNSSGCQMKTHLSWQAPVRVARLEPGFSWWLASKTDQEFLQLTYHWLWSFPCYDVSFRGALQNCWEVRDEKDAGPDSSFLLTALGKGLADFHVTGQWMQNFSAEDIILLPSTKINSARASFHSVNTLAMVFLSRGV